MNVTPNSVGVLSTGTIQLDITGITAGTTVRVERHIDLANDGVINSNDPLVQSFLLTDGGVTVFGGVRDINVPGDDDLTVDGDITAHFSMTGLAELGRGVGHYLFRVSSPTDAFTAFTVPFTITPTADGQSISGTVMSGASPVPYAMVGLLVGAQGEYYMGVLADGSGNYSINAPPGNYMVMPIADGNVTDFSALPAVALVAGVSQTGVNLALTAVTNSISGSVTDSVTSAGLPGVQVAMETSTGKFALTFTKSDGTFVRGVTADTWSVDVSELSLSPLGYLRMNNSVPAVTTGGDVAGLNISLTKATALVYGLVVNASTTPIAGLRMYASDPTHTYDQNALTDGNGYYVIGVIAGTWDVGVNSMENPALAGYMPPQGVAVSPAAGQAAQANFTLSAVTAHLQGSVLKDGGSFNWGLPGLTVMAFNMSNQMIQTTTDASGNFDLGVYAGTWSISLEGSSAASNSVVGPQLSRTIADAQTINDVSIPALSTTAQINGTVTANSTSVAGAFPYARATINTLSYQASGQTNGAGQYSLPVANGTWMVGVTNSGYVNPLEQQITISGSNQTADFALGNTPIIGAHPADQNVNDGQSAFFTVYTTGGVMFTYQWEYSTNSGSSWSNVPMGPPYSGVIGSTLWMLAGSSMNGYMYRCVVINGVESVTSNAATLTVGGGGGGNTAPSVIAQPSNQVVTAGDTAYFTAAFSGNPAPTLQWQVSTDSGSNWSNLTGDMTYSGVNSVSMSAVTTLGMNGYIYRCVGTNLVNSATTNTATLTVNSSGSPTVSMAAITKSMHYVQIADLTEVPHPSLPWAFHAHVEGTNLSSINAPTFVSPATSGTAGASLAYNGNLWAYDFYFADQTALDAAFKSGVYTLTATATDIALNLSGNAYPNPPEVAVSAGTWSDSQLHLASTQALSLVTNSFTNYANLSAYPMSHILVSIIGPNYQNQAELLSNDTPGTNYGTLNIPANSLTPGATYTVQARFDGGVDVQSTLGMDLAMYSTVTEFQLVVDGPPNITVHPYSQSVAVGQGLIFGVNATGSPVPFFYQWKISTDGGVFWSDLYNDSTYSGTNTANLGVSNVTTALSRNLYRCVVSNSYGPTTSNAALLRVTPLVTVFSGTDDFSTAVNWSVATRPGGIADLAFANNRLEYLASAPTGADNVIREWTPNVGSYTQDWAVQVDVHLDTMSLPAGQYVNLNLAVMDSADAMLPMNQMDMMDVAIDRYGTGVNTVHNFEGDLQGNGVRIPTEGLIEVINNATDAALRISFDSTTKTLTSWFDADGALNGYVWTQLQSVVIGSGTYNWNMDANGTFAVVLAGGSGGVTLTSGQAWFDNFQAAAPVSGAPAITVQPDSQSVTAGQNAVFGLTATGDPAPDYQWQVSTDGGVTWGNLSDNASYSGVTTASLTVTAVAASQSRNLYHCIVSNTVDSATSNPAALRVAPTATAFAGFDDFTGATNWSAPMRLAGGDGHLNFVNSRLEYGVGTATANDAVIREWTPNVGSYTQDWAVQVDVHLDSYSLSGDQYVNLNLAVFNAAEALIPLDTADMMDIAIDRYADGGNTIRSIEGDLRGNGVRDPAIGMLSIANSTTDAALRISFNSTTKYLTSWYDADGAANGYNWVMLQSIDIGSGTFTWGMNDGSTFAVALAGGARHLSISSAQAWFENFHAAAPRLTTQPQGQVVPTGGSVTLSAVAAGAAPFTYQWSKNGVNIGGATNSSYSLVNFQPNDAATYHVVVTDVHGVTLVSSGANLTELKPVSVFDISGVAGLRGLAAAYDGTNYLVAIQGGGGTAESITAQFVSSAGALVGSRINLGQTAANLPMVSFDGTHYLIVWAGTGGGINGQLLTTAGAQDGSAFAISPRTASGGRAQLIFAGGSYLVCWATDGVIYGQWVSPAGALNGSEFAISGVTTLARDFGLAYNGTNVFVVWSGGGTYRPVVYGQLLNAGSGLVGGTLTIDNDGEASDNPIAVGSDGSNFMVVYPDEVGPVDSRMWNLNGQIVNGAGGLQGAAFQINGSPGPLLAMRLAFDGTNYLFAFSNMNATSPGCLFRFISTAGEKLGPSGFALFPTQGSDNPIVAVPLFAGGKYFIPATYGTWLQIMGGDPMAGVRVYGAFLDPGAASSRSTQTITFNALPDVPFTATPITLTATATSGLTVTFNVTGPATVLGNSLTLTGVGLVTVTATQIGDASYLSAPDVPRSFTVTPNFTSWQLDNFTPEEIANPLQSGPNAVFGLDGLPNLVKYALGLNPQVNATSGLPEVSTDATYWLYTYTRPADRTDVTFVVEYSTNLTTWTTLVTGVDHVYVTTNAGIETWRAKYPLASAANVYFRLKVIK